MSTEAPTPSRLAAGWSACVRGAFGKADHHLLFSYGTLQQPEVQVATFGVELTGEADAVVGHRLGEVTIEDPHVLAVSGSAVHPALVPAHHPEAEVAGTVYALTDEQLARADEYEVYAYTRVEVLLRSGRTAWVYALDTALP